MLFVCRRFLHNSRVFGMAQCAASLEEYFAPPEAVRGCQVLDRAAFKRDIEVPAISLAHPRLCSSFKKKFAHVCLRFPSVKNILTETSENGKEPVKVLLLVPHHLMKSPLSPEDKDWIRTNQGEEVTRVLTFTYEDYSKHAILKAILPAEFEAVPSGYEAVGHIAHYNLNKEYLPYKNIIGQVTLDKQRNLRTVVNKTEQIDNTFRFFKMEVLAGEPDLVATVKRNGCTFTFDFSKVYWNSGLSTEHMRVVELLKKEDVVLDVFAGVGPFAIPAAKLKGCTVHANDLNPHSYQYLKENVAANHVSDLVKCYNLDGREFIISTVTGLVERAPQGGVVCSHVIMNLPASAVQFLDSFRGLFTCVPEDLRPSFTLPLIHCYCFVRFAPDKKDDIAAMEEDAVQLVTSHLGKRPEHCSVQMVRDVAPNKNLMRVSFELPKQVAYCQDPAQLEPGQGGELDQATSCEEPPTKRSKTTAGTA